jgi:hypothetical protein
MILPLSLTDAELDMVMAAARQLQRHQRDGFLRHIAQALAAMPDRRGEGAVHRVIAGVWRAHFDPPLFTDSCA